MCATKIISVCTILWLKNGATHYDAKLGLPKVRENKELFVFIHFIKNTKLKYAEIRPCPRSLWVIQSI